MSALSSSRMALCAGVTLATLSGTGIPAQEAWMIVIHEVEDFDRWEAVFDEALPTRRAVGETSSYILHDPTDRNRVTVWFEWDSMSNAKAFATDPVLANGMAAAGVISAPVFSFRAIGGFQLVEAGP